MADPYMAEAVPEAESRQLYTLNWESEPVEYEHFTDLSHYMLEMEASVKDTEAALKYVEERQDIYSSFSSANCSGTVKKNSDNEVIMSHSMDVEISTHPGVIVRIRDGKYDTLCITYQGAVSPYEYTSEGLAALDKDNDYLRCIPYAATDVMNEAGLYNSYGR